MPVELAGVSHGAPWRRRCSLAWAARRPPVRTWLRCWQRTSETSRLSCCSTTASISSTSVPPGIWSAGCVIERDGLATSREPLSVPGEVVWRVPSLNAPPPVETLPLESNLSQYDAVRLFIDRARTARPSFAVTDANAPAIAQICHRLDGISPGARTGCGEGVASSPPNASLTIWSNRFRLLTGAPVPSSPDSRRWRHPSPGAVIA